MRVLLLENARSGTRARHRRRAAFVERLTREGIEVAIESPASSSDMRARAQSVLRSEFDVLLASGGDGTLHTVVNGLARVRSEERPRLAILPFGRGNDFAFDVGLRDENVTFEALLRGSSRLLDLGRTFSMPWGPTPTASRSGTRPPLGLRTPSGVFLGVAGTGFDARVARRAQETPLLSGSALYTWAVFRTLTEFRPIQARVRHESGTYEGPITFAAAGNSRRYGGGMRITPRAELDDGALDLCLVREISRATLLRMFPTVFSGRHLSHPKVEYVRTRFVEIETEAPAEVYADGELLQETPVRIEVAPRELEVVAPVS